ncbi:MAG: FAD-dependent oxidoreductase [Firmicutes bacterium]|jgi:hypothetical protein|nr:FAD-dependent oxidoreductase [Bacillota bacterium]
MKQFVVVGGGWAGCAAALAAAKKGLKVTLLERTDRLLGSGLVGGIMRNNGRYTAAEELSLMGAGELIAITDQCARHTGVNFPGHSHATLYDVTRIEAPVEEILRRHGVTLILQSRVTGLVMKGRRIQAVVGEDGSQFGGDLFIDAGGSAGLPGICRRSGNGCAMCIYRCPTFGSRVSIAARAGVEEAAIRRPDGAAGFFSGSCELEPASLAPHLVEAVTRTGVLVIPLPAELRRSAVEQSVEQKACRQYSAAAYKENIILLDTGAIKMMAPFFPLEQLRRLDGFERAVYRDPLSGGRGNSIRFSTVVRRNNRLLAPPVENLLVAGERAGPAVGHTEAMITGTLAGYNAWLLSRGAEPLAYPRGTVAGELVAFTGAKGHSLAGGEALYNTSGGALWEHLKKLGLYTTDRTAIRKRLEIAGLFNIFA